MWWIFSIGFFVAAIGGSAQQMKASFSCDGRITGYYADVSSGCQVYHMCDGLGRMFSYTCPNATLFQQRMLICDHWYMVNCSRSERDYGANLLIGQNKPFVEDYEYDRTPRPDLLTASRNESEFNIIYRTGRQQDYTPKNVVGIETYDETSTDEPTYFPPSHWSTSYTPQQTTTYPRRTNTEDHQENQVQDVPRFNFRKENGRSRTRAKAISFGSSNRNGNTFASNPRGKQAADKPVVNFNSNFKATTPVYPASVEDTTSSVDDIGLEPPLPAGSQIGSFVGRKPAADLFPPDPSDKVRPVPDGFLPPKVNFQSNFKATTPVYPSRAELDQELDYQPRVVFESSFKATTPVYPTSVDPTSPDPGEAGLLAPLENRVVVNFESKFKATTPNYPTSVEPTSPDPGEVGLIAPQERAASNLVNFPSNFTATTPVYPTSVEQTSPNPSEAGLVPPQGSITNFQSNFTATTPVYPTHVDATSPDPGEVGLEAPNGNSKAGVPGLILGFLPPKFDANYRIDRDQDVGTTAVSPPSQFYQAPRFDPDYTLDDIEENVVPGVRILNFMKSFNRSQWQDLRKAFSIPEYDFPLDEATRPSYDSVYNSFGADPEKKR